MSNWLSPDVETLREVISSSEGDLLLCSPYISTPALSIVADTLPTAVTTIEFWTKLDPRDWITGASDPEGLLDFIHQSQGHVGHVSVRHDSHLHAKTIVSDGLKAMAGSANLTAGGFMRNMEVPRLVTGGEIDQLHRIANELRPKLALITQDRLAEFVSDCTTKVESKEALLDLIRQELPSFEADQGSLMPYRDFLSYLRGCVRRLGHVLEWRYETQTMILSQKVCAGRIRTNAPTPGYNIQSLFRILPQHTVALRCAKKSLELPQNGFLRGNQTIPQRPDRRTVGCSGFPTPISQDRGKATYCRPTGGRQRHCVRSAQRLHVASHAA